MTTVGNVPLIPDYTAVSCTYASWRVMGILLEVSHAGMSLMHGCKHVLLTRRRVPSLDPVRRSLQKFTNTKRPPGRISRARCSRIVHQSE